MVTLLRSRRIGGRKLIISFATMIGFAKELNRSKALQSKPELRFRCIRLLSSSRLRGHHMPRKPPFLHGRRKCIFCERQPPDIKITGEHIFSDWLRELFPRDDKTTHTQGVITWPLAGPPDVPPSIKLSPKLGHSGSRKVSAVCDRCNERWMSNLEEAAKPILIQMITGRGGEISPSMQRTLATWAAKTAMTGERIVAESAVIKQSQRAWLKERLEPPKDWIIWAVPYSGTEWRNLGLFQHSGRVELAPVNDDGAVEHSLGLTFMGMGHLLLQIFHTSWPGYWDGVLDARHTTRIWPLTGETIQWPAPYVFSDLETKYFSNYMSRILDQRVDFATN